MDRFNPGEWLDNALAWMDRHELAIMIGAAILFSAVILAL